MIGVLRTVVEALHAGTTNRVSGLPRLYDDLNQLASILPGKDQTLRDHNLREAGLNALRVALIHHVWPDVYPTLTGASNQHGVNRRTAAAYSSSLSDTILRCFGTHIRRGCNCRIV